MADALWMKIREIEWDKFPANGNANVPNLLKNLASRKEQRAMKASQQMWTALCGSGKIHAAAEPCVPFLVEILSISTIGVQDSIIDIFSSLLTKEKHAWLQPHQQELQPLLKSKDEIIVAKMKDLLDALNPAN